MSLELILPSLALCAVAFAFGVVLKLSDLLQEHGYRWFPGAAMATGIASAALAVGMLVLSHAVLHVMWLAVLASWLLRGRIDGPNHGVMALAMLVTVLFFGPELAHYREPLIYFAAVLLPLGAIHDLLQYTSMKAPRPIEWFFEQQHLYWYAMAAGYCVLFEIDPRLCLCVYGFVKGYGHLYDEARRERLARWGIRKAPDAPQG